MGVVVAAEALADDLQKLRHAGKKIVLCHGCFDLMHPGHIKHFQAAKKMGDVLVVTVTPDVYVDKGPGRPAYNQDLRASSVAALECVDFVAINKWPTAEETLRLLMPHVFVKGQEFEDSPSRTWKLHRESAVAKEIGCEIRFTHEVVFSSTQLLNTYFR
jgi:rfaE bifunctional protein nucleotidyltransferase chain/domain